MGDVPAGWYPDPQGLADERFFDGEAWSQQVRSVAPAEAAASAAAPSERPVNDLERVLAASLATANYTRVIALSVLASLWAAVATGLLVVVISSVSSYDRGGGVAFILIFGIGGLLVFIVAIIGSFNRGTAFQRQAQ
jgi:hypothetical protein